MNLFHKQICSPFNLCNDKVKRLEMSLGFLSVLNKQFVTLMPLLNC